MAPELALSSLEELPGNGIVLDPMAGSGTVLRQASALGHQALGFDMDPLAVLMSSVWTTPVDEDSVRLVSKRIIGNLNSTGLGDISTPWIDDDPETAAFVDFWFAKSQQNELRKIASVLRALEQDSTPDERIAIDVSKIALSRIIITKDRGASLARDVSHSRPHKVAETNDFNVRHAFERSIETVISRLSQSPPSGNTVVKLGDARSLTDIANKSIDGVLTSPPYLNAIDYMRGHKLSLVWLGHSLKELRTIRSASIGSERKPDAHLSSAAHTAAKAAMGELTSLPNRFGSMIDRYVHDIIRMMAEIARVMKPGGRATFVMGDSCLRGVFIRNSQAVSVAAQLAGLKLLSETERPLPTQSRYLPMTSDQLSKRMRTETILTFATPS
jgi:hypothetical protein